MLFGGIPGGVKGDANYNVLITKDTGDFACVISIAKSDSLIRNVGRRNWNSVGDHAPAYLINYYDNIPFVQEKFYDDWSHNKTWGWQQNRGDCADSQNGHTARCISTSCTRNSRSTCTLSPCLMVLKARIHYTFSRIFCQRAVAKLNRLIILSQNKNSAARCKFIF